MYDGHYQRQVRRESRSFLPPKSNSRGGRKCLGSLENATSLQSFCGNARSAPDGWMVSQDSEGLLPILTSALCSCTVFGCSTCYVLSLRVASQIMAWHMCHLSTRLQTSWQVTHLFQFEVGWLVVQIPDWAYVSLALSVLARCNSLTVEAPANYQTSDGLLFLYLWLKAWPLPPEPCCEMALLCERASGWHTEQRAHSTGALVLCLVSQYLGYQREQID